MAEGKLKPANENPWYVLATIYGEQEGQEIDRELAVRNVRVWNAWATQGMTAAEIVELREGAASDLVGAGEWEDVKAAAEKEFGIHTGRRFHFRHIHAGRRFQVRHFWRLPKFS